MGYGEHLATLLSDYFKKLTDISNPIGDFYIKFQTIFRILIVEVLLDDIFELTADGSELECDTNQVACNEMCFNRFVPINFMKVWQIELYGVVCIIMLFATLFYASKNFFESESGKKLTTRSTMTSVQHQIYLAGLICRLAFEIYMARIEMELGKHQTGNETFPEMFYLPEKFMCMTNKHDVDTDHLWKDNSYFRIDSELGACNKQSTSIPCWISQSHLKSKGMIAMFIVQCLSILITCTEIVYEIVKICFCLKPKRSQDPEVSKLNA